jgi:BirA family transcriptional regulator, biotin operon repressor / biotin---[acetyl-CoA-carboxylase] ligase
LYKIPANTLFVGKNLVFVPECHSTNTLAMELSQRGSIADGTVIITDNQQAGRGQRGNQWISEPGKNLTFSVVLKPGFIKADQQFRLTQVISLAVTDYLKNRLDATIKIKWPNDILVNQLKTCGILIENSLSGDTIQFVVVGIGLNVNQISMPNNKATSLKQETGKDYILENELQLLLQAIEVRYVQLREGKINLLENDYLINLYRKGELHGFNTMDGVLKGMIEGVDQRGRLVLQTSEGKRFYDLKEISFADKEV